VHARPWLNPQVSHGEASFIGCQPLVRQRISPTSHNSHSTYTPRSVSLYTASKLGPLAARDLPIRAPNLRALLTFQISSSHNPLNDINSRSRSSRLSSEHLAIFPDDEYASLRALPAARLTQPDRFDQVSFGVAQQRVGEVLLCLEGCVGLWGVGGQAVDREAGGGQRLVGVAEEAGLGGAWESSWVSMAAEDFEGRKADEREAYSQAWKP
jgi:hypothetical protein